MKSILQLANDAPRLSQRDLDVIDRAHNQDGKILKRDGLQDMAKMENWGVP
jgi:hypothetical protein